MAEPNTPEDPLAPGIAQQPEVRELPRMLRPFVVPAYRRMALALVCGAFAYGVLVALGPFEVIWGTLLQRRIPPELLGRIASLDAFVSISLMPVSMALAAPVSHLIGIPDTFLLAGASPIVFAGIALWWARLSEDELANPLR